MYVCLCKCVTDHEIRDLLESPFINDVDDVGAACGAGTGCGTCRDEIRELCDEARAGRVEAVTAAATHAEIAEVAVRIGAGARAG